MGERDFKQTLRRASAGPEGRDCWLKCSICPGDVLVDYGGQEDWKSSTQALTAPVLHIMRHIVRHARDTLTS